MSLYYPKCGVVMRFSYGDNKKGAVQFYPKSCEVKKDMYRQAATFRIVADYQYFPFDPRIILSPQVDIHFEDVAQQNNFQITPDNLVFLGYVNRMQINAMAQEITFEGVDYTGIFLEASATFTVPQAGQDILSIFNEVKSEIDAAANLSILYKPSGSPPVVTQAIANISNTVSLNQHVQKDSSAWEFMQNVALSVGLICYMQLDTIVIDDPTHFKMNLQNDSYCFGHGINSGNTVNIVMDRKNGKFDSMQVELRCLQGKNLIIAQYPETVDLSPQIIAKNVGDLNAPVVKKRKVQKIVQTVSGNFNHDTLVGMAKRVYNELKSYQSSVKVTTRDLNVFTYNSKSSNTKLSIFNVKIGENIQIIDLWDTYSISSTLRRKGWDSTIADDLSSLQASVQRLFYIEKIEFTFSNVSGFICTIGGLSRLNLNGSQEPQNH